MDSLLNTHLYIYHKNNKIFFSDTSSPFLTESIKQKIENHYSNGLSRYIKNIFIEVISDIKECKNIWNHFSNSESIFDTWDFRYLFYKCYNTKPLFLTIKRDSKILAVLPLMYQPIYKKYTWFGTDWTEDNKFFSVDNSYIPLLIYLAPKPLILDSINRNSIKNIPEFLTFSPDDSNYYIDTSKYRDMDEYLESLKKKHRYNLKRDYKNILKLNPFLISDKKYKNIFYSLIEKRMHSLSLKSYFDEDPLSKNAFDILIQNKSNLFKIKMLSVKINNDIAVCDLLVYYKNIVYPILGGNDISKYPGIGNFMNYCEIENSINNKNLKIDYLRINYGWKNKYLTEEKRYKFETSE